MQPAVVADKLSLTFGGTLAVSDVNFEVAPGQIVTIVGPSGCGKSSLLRLIAGLERPSSGRIDLANGARMSFVFQDPALLPWATASKNVALPLELDGQVEERAVESALDQVGLGRWAKSYPAQLSGGMRMRVSIARALVRKPQLLLMDEPFAALDELRRFDLAEQVRRIAKEQNLTVLFVTHSVFEACFLSDRVLVMSSAPGTLAHEVGVEGEQPRAAAFRETTAFNEACADVSAALRSAAQSVAI